jgi:hypothetical protein
METAKKIEAKAPDGAQLRKAMTEGTLSIKTTCSVRLPLI